MHLHSLLSRIATLLDLALLTAASTFFPLHDPLQLSTSTHLIALHTALLSIPSTLNNESAATRFLAQHLRDLNFTVELQPIPPSNDTNPTTSNSSDGSDVPPPSRYNILAYRAPHRQTRVLLTTHLDTVAPHFRPSITGPAGNPRLYGRGANDCKGCVAAQVVALTDLLRTNAIEPSDAALLFVLGEETSGDGMRAASAGLGLSWEAVVFGEPTEGRLVSGHKGIVGFRITARGRAAHSGYPWLGRSAVDMLLPALRAVEALERTLPRSAKFGATTVNVGALAAGVGMNVVPELAVAEIAVRLAGGTAAGAREVIARTVRAVDERLEVEFLIEGYGPVDCDVDVEGFEVLTVNYGTDVPNLAGEHKRYLYGAGSILVAHSDHEYVELRELEGSVDGYKRLVLGSLEKGMKEKQERDFELR